MLGESLVDKRIVGIQQVDYVAIFAQNAFEQHLRFLAEALAKIVVKSTRFRLGRF